MKKNKKVIVIGSSCLLCVDHEGNKDGVWVIQLVLHEGFLVIETNSEDVFPPRLGKSEEK